MTIIRDLPSFEGQETLIIKQWTVLYHVPLYCCCLKPSINLSIKRTTRIFPNPRFVNNLKPYWLLLCSYVVTNPQPVSQMNRHILVPNLKVGLH